MWTSGPMQATTRKGQEAIGSQVRENELCKEGEAGQLFARQCRFDCYMRKLKRSRRVFGLKSSKSYNWQIHENSRSRVLVCMEEVPDKDDKDSCYALK